MMYINGSGMLIELYQLGHRPRYLSSLGHSLQSHSAPVPIKVRYASDSDHSNHGPDLTLSANNGHFDFLLY